ncbi:uncharacterized protein LOC123872518 [Maniola jurtina]|uniref:uncharacterized protein LOC123872518 n=1 Tax=Maniola jurtina TaxID=191418 RepID=UPI001E68E6C1|nr:uncharacterized protein LOC123872518 [Maniola jurtina]
MATPKLSHCFKLNFFFLKILGIWPGKNSHRYYKYYAIFILCLTFFSYNSLIVANIFFTPMIIEEMIVEVVFLFTQFTVIGKVFMIYLKRKKLLAAIDVLNCESFKSKDEDSKEIIERHNFKYKMGRKIYMSIGQISYFAKVFMPILMHLIFNSPLELPICRYNFLDSGIVQRYFTILFIYQSVGLYFNMMFNLTIDSLIAGLLYMAIVQVKVVKHHLKKLRILKKKNSLSEEDEQFILLNKYLKYYEIILNYCDLVQDITGMIMFIQFSFTSVMICIILCRLLLPWTVDFFLFLITYLCAINTEIFVPSWLGTELNYESAELVSAAYSSEWIPRSERFKRSLKLFMTRATTSITMTGSRIFPLSLDTYISIVKLAYSFFTLIRNFQDSQEITSMRQLESLSITLFCWKLLGIWPGENPSRLYRFYTILFLFSTLIIYDTALAVNLFYTPRKIEILLQEVTFFFNVMSITTKVLMVILYRKRIVELLKILDDEMFHGKCGATRTILAEGTNSYIRYRNVLLVMAHFAYTFNSIIPFIAYLIIPAYQTKFPTSNYYFLDEDTKKYYFSFIYGYQAFGIYGLMMFDVTVDTFINGCLFFTISQIKALNYKLSNLELDKSIKKLSKNLKEHAQIMKLNECLRHYDCILKYCAKLQNIINFSLFVQYAMGAMIICELSCSLLLPLTSEEYTFLVTFLSAMIMQIFVPSWLGTQISYESQELVFAAYNSDWIPRTEPFKKSIKIFVERANTPIVMVGLKMFPLSLEMFTSIMKTAYSFMTLVRSVQDREELQ